MAVCGEIGISDTKINHIFPGLYRFGDTRHVFSDVSKLKAFGWQPEVSQEEIVDEYLSWAQEQPGFKDYYSEAEAKMQQLGTLRKVSA